jgi:hypothetical protein
MYQTQIEYFYIYTFFKCNSETVRYTGVPELAPQRKQTNADDNLDSKNANEEQLMACIREL